MSDNVSVVKVGSLPGSPVKDHRVASACKRRPQDELVSGVWGMQGDDIGQLNCRVPLTIRLRETKQGKDSVHIVRTLHGKHQYAFTRIVPSLPKSIDRGALFPPTILYGASHGGWLRTAPPTAATTMSPTPGWTRRRTSFSQLRTVFSIVGK